MNDTPAIDITQLVRRYGRADAVNGLDVRVQPSGGGRKNDDADQALGVRRFRSGWNDGVIGQEPTCLHGPTESAAQLARRQRALRLTRDINSAEAAESGRAGKYLSLEQLPISAGIPQDFVIHLSSDGTGYAFSVKDTLDPCAFGYFSDESGRIYRGEGIR